MTRLACRDLSRAPWWRGVDLSLEAGELVVLRGPSGSGKTLFLRSLADLDPRDSGSLELDGVRCEDHSPADWRARVRYVHQRPRPTSGTVGEHLEMLTGLQRFSNLALAPPEGLQPSAELARLSGGEVQRLFLHIALATAPDILLLDEPTSALDEARAREAEAAVLAFVEQGRCALWVSHQAGLAARLGAREVTLA